MSKAKAAPAHISRKISELCPQPIVEQRLPDEHLPHSLGGFTGAFIGMFGRKPTDREIWDHAIRSYQDLKEPKLADLPTGVTDEHIDRLIVEVAYPQVPQGTLTVATIRTVTGHVEVGTSACVTREKFNPETGMKYALEEARNKLVEHEAYLLRHQRHHARQ